MTDASRRVFLFLQGPPNTFARNLANELEARGHRALRVNLCLGDLIYWHGRPAFNYRGRLCNWEDYLRSLIAREGVTHILYYADRLPYHRVAIALADELGIAAVSYEFGYLRPDWITLEYRGMSAQSHFPEDPTQIRQIAQQVDDPDLTVRYRYPFIREAFHEVIFNLSNFFFFFVFPYYEADKVYNRLIEYLSYIPRLALASRNSRHAERAVRSLITKKTPFFVFPLQMQNDYQIRCNTRHARLNEPIRATLISFGEHAPKDAELVFKLHPLDNGLEHWERVIPGMAHELGIGDRVRFLDGGDLTLLLRHACGTVLLNSTVGIHALQLDCPTKVLGIATFDIPGLTSQCSLDRFWSEPQKPDPQLRDDFIKALAATIQVKGNFYTREGQASAIPEVAERLITNKVNQPDGFVDPPPRLSRAIAQGISGARNDIDCAPSRLPRQT